MSFLGISLSGQAQWRSLTLAFDLRLVWTLDSAAPLSLVSACVLVVVVCSGSAPSTMVPSIALLGPGVSGAESLFTLR